MWKIEKVSRWKDKKFYYFAVCQNKTHGKVMLCRVPKKSTRQSISLPCAKKKHTAKHIFVVCCIFVVCAHGKEIICRMSDKKHTLNFLTHSKHEVSCSDVWQRRSYGGGRGEGHNFESTVSERSTQGIWTLSF